MKAFTLSLIALPLLAAAAEDGSSFGSRGRHHVQRSQLYRGHRHRHHPSGLFKANSVAACGANTTDVETPEKLAEGSLDALHGCVEWHEIGSDDTCSSLLQDKQSNMTINQFITLNPGVYDDCWGLQREQFYCTAITECLAEGAFTLEQNCTSWAQATGKDTYRTLAANHNVTLADLRSFNKNVGDIQEGSFYCISNQTALDTTPPTWHETWTADQAKKVSNKVKQQKEDAAAAASTEDNTPEQNTETPEQEQAPAPSSTSAQENTWTEQNTQQDQNTWTEQNTWVQQESASPEPEPTTTASPEPEPTTTEQSSGGDGDSNGGGNGGGSNGGSNGGGGTARGDATFFQPGLGSCGGYNSASDYIAAAPAALYAITGDSICGQSVTINYEGKSVTVQITDKCPECDTCSFDLSPSAFQQLAPSSAGRIQMTWDAAQLGIDASVC